MAKDLAESLLYFLQPAAERGLGDGAEEVVREAIDRYHPANLSELYMAVRAAAPVDGMALIDVLEGLAARDPQRSLREFVEP